MSEWGPVRRSHTMTAVAERLLESPQRERYGYELCRAPGSKSGTLSPILARFKQAGWITDRWQDPAEADHHPLRRYFRLTDEGRVALPVLVARGRQLR